MRCDAMRCGAMWCGDERDERDEGDVGRYGRSNGVVVGGMKMRRDGFDEGY